MIHRNLSLLNNISCASVTATGAISCASVTTTDITTSNNIICGNKLTVSNGLVVNGTNNESKYFTLKGSSYYGGVSSSFTYKKFDGSSGTSSSETIQIHGTCRCVKINYAYDTTNASNTIFKGCTEYVFVKYLNDVIQYWQQYTAWQVGDNNFQPTFSINSSDQLIVNFPTNTTAYPRFLSWTFAINML